MKNNGITELAQLFKQREPKSEYSPAFGKVTSLPNIKVSLGDKIILSSEHLKICCDITEQDIDSNYINIGKTVVLLPYADNQKYVLIGVIR